jgi:hypothetical protein
MNVLVCLQDSTQQQQAQLQALEQLLAQSKQQAEQQLVRHRLYDIVRALEYLQVCNRTKRQQLL